MKHKTIELTGALLDAAVAKLCVIGWHDYRHTHKWIPSINAPIVEELEHKIQCVRCGKMALHRCLKWNGRDMVEVDASTQDHK